MRFNFVTRAVRFNFVTREAALVCGGLLRFKITVKTTISVSLDGSCARKAKTNREVYTVQAAEADREDGRKGCAIVDAAVAAFTLAPQQGRRVRHHNN